MSFWIGVGAFVVLMLFAIFFHELGHFVTARWAGIKVSKFFVGFGPTLWSVRRGRPETVTLEERGRTKTITRAETEYGVKALPLGGFVKIVGMSPFEEIPPEDEPRAFNSVPAWKRAIVLVAGSVTHFITAFFVLFLIFAVVGLPDPDSPTTTIDAVQLEIGGEPSPAARAGLEPGDRIVEVDGEQIGSFEDLRRKIRSKNGEPVYLTVIKRDGTRREADLDPVIDRVGGQRVPVIGIYPQNEAKRQSVFHAARSSVRAMQVLLFGGEVGGERQAGFFQRLPEAFSPDAIFSRGPSEERPFSIVGAGRIAADLVSRGRIVDFLALFVQINIFVAIFNMLPLPPLDGGHLLVLGIEKVRAKPIHPRALLPVMAVVMGLLLMLGIFLIFRDIVEPPQLPGG